MPAKSPRVQVTVSEEQHKLLLELASLQGRSASSYLREVLDTLTPVLRELVPAVRQASEDAQQAQGVLQSKFTGLLTAAMETVTIGQEDLFSLLDEAEKAGLRPRSGAASGSERVREQDARRAS